MAAASDDAAGLGYADFLVRQNRIDDALAELQRLVGAHPDSIRARVGELRLLLATRRIDEATRSARRGAKFWELNNPEDTPRIEAVLAEQGIA